MALETYQIVLLTKKQRLPKEDGRMKEPEKIRKRKIMFICTGNTCRSPMAECMLKHILKKNKISKYYNVTSAGLMATDGSPMSANSIAALKKLEISGGAKHKSKQFYAAIVPKKDLIITMTSAHKLVIGNYFNVFSLDELTDCRDIPDPYGGDQKSYDRIAEILLDAMNTLFDRVININQ